MLFPSLPFWHIVAAAAADDDELAAVDRIAQRPPARASARSFAMPSWPRAAIDIRHRRRDAVAVDRHFPVCARQQCRREANLCKRVAGNWPGSTQCNTRNGRCVQTKTRHAHAPLSHRWDAAHLLQLSPLRRAAGGQQKQPATTHAPAAGPRKTAAGAEQFGCSRTRVWHPAGHASGSQKKCSCTAPDASVAAVQERQSEQDTRFLSRVCRPNRPGPERKRCCRARAPARTRQGF